VDYKVILNLMKEMNNNGLTKLEIEEEGIKIRMEKAAPVVNAAQPAFPQTAFAPGYIPAAAFQQVQPPVIPGPQTTAPGVQTAVFVNSGSAEDGVDKQTEDIGCRKLVSPMVGTFYSASAPDKPPFVKIGDKVKKGQTICIIEAMKLMNEIESEHDGEIVKILINNEEMVEFGQPLFLIK
jgi:acetyl-CoA carboxylase biotin carboxyl carrier protein